MFQGIVRQQKELFRSDDGLCVQLYSVRKVVEDEEKHLQKRYITVKGFGLPREEQVKKLNLEIRGEWVKHPKYGWQIEVTGWREEYDDTKTGILKFLEKGPLKGCGAVTAKKIYASFGDRTIQVLNEEPEQLLNVQGITSKKARELIASWKENTASREVMSILMPLGIPPAMCMSVVKRYGAAAADVVKTQPWRLVREIPGITYPSVDLLVHKRNLPLDSEERVQAALEYALLENEGSGNMGMELKSLFQATNVLLKKEIPERRIAEIRNNLLLEQSLRAVHLSGQTFIFRREAYDAEKLFARRIISLMKCSKKTFRREDIESSILKAEKKAGISYSDEQRQAVVKALSSPIMVLSGGPGVGKTATLNLIAGVLEDLAHAKICQLSPTGKAAKRMKDATQRPAQTIDSKLELTPRIGSFVTDVPKISEDVTIVDESSMLDAYKAVSLAYAMEYGHSLIFVGDVNQLPSVGPGNVLKGLIASGVCPVQYLTHIYRQEGEENPIVTNAYKVNNGETDLQVHEKNFHFVAVESSDEKLSQYLSKSYLHYRQIYGRDNVICLLPTKKTEFVGTEDMNRSIQELINPVDDSGFVRVFGYKIHSKDLVMNTQNNLEKGIVNGDVGTVLSVTKNEDGSHTVKIDFDGKLVSFEGEEVQHLSLGYALTIHKSQGSEYDAVIIGLSPRMGKRMMKRNLLYTAITRAKKDVIIIGSRDALNQCICSGDAEKRLSLLSIFLRQEKEKSEKEA